MSKYNDPLYIDWHRNSQGQEYSVLIQNESHKITKNIIFLTQLPDIQRRVLIDGMYETDGVITSPQFYKVNYENGMVTFHSSLDQSTINVSKYYGRGIIMYPASRIWTKIDDFGEVTSTLDNVVERMDEVAGTIINLDNTIKNANNTKTNLDTSITTGNITKSQLDTSIDNANNINNTLSDPLTGTIKKATDINTTLSNTTSLAETTNDTLSQTNAQAQTIKSELDSSISTGNTLKVDLDSNISIGTTLNNDLNANIDEGNQLKIALPPLIGDADTSKTNLETTIGNANTKKSELDSSISTASTTKTDLDTSVTNANNINDTLSSLTDGTIKQATDINNTLSATIDTASDSKVNLDTSISNSTDAKMELDSSVYTANATKAALDGSITEGHDLKSDLDAIISGTDYEQVIMDMDNLKIEKADKTYVDAELANKVDNNRVLTDVPVDAKFTDTTYSEITEEEIDIGTSSTLRTITGRRIKYILDKIQGWISALTKADVGLGNVQDYGIATQSEAETGTSDIKYMTPLKTKQAIDKFKPKDTSELTKSDVYTKTEIDTALAGKVDNSRVLTDVPANAKFTDTITTINNTLTSVSTTEALSANQGKVLNDKINILNDDLLELKYSELSSTATNIDDEGIYQNIEWKRKDNTLYAKSTLIGTTPNYNQIKIDYYNETGTTIIKTITWDLTYDDNNFPYTRTVI